jgi:WD40 repeat protein/predicted Ser/Thr protein kinase
MLQQGLAGDSYVETIEFTPGRTFCGYEIVRKLGVGGMGVVYEARQKSLRRAVALKMVRYPGASSPKDMARFRQEAEAAARLNHPNIVEVYEIGELDGHPYFTMRFVEGAESLGSELSKGAFDPRRAAELIRDVARAAAYAHQRGVIHRDLKPANILLDGEGRPCLVDFGLAKLFGSTENFTESRANLSDDGKLIGTPYYMSPEQVQGGDLTTATDVYSLGVVLYELLSGSPPFRSQSLHGMLDDITHLPPKALVTKDRKLPADLEVICFKCLRKDPQNRYPTADALADDLERWLEQKPITARPSSKRDRIAKWARRNPGVAVLSPVVAVLAMVAIGLLSWMLVKERRRAVEEMEIAENRRVEELRRAEDLVTMPLREATLVRTEKKIAGRRWEAIEKLKTATVYLEGLKNTRKEDDKRYEELRKEIQNQVLACLQLIDLRPSEDRADFWKGDPGGTGLISMSPDFSWYAHATKDGKVMVRDRAAYKDPIPLDPKVDGRCLGIRFDAEGGKLAAVFETEAADETSGFQLFVWDIASEDLLWSGSVNGHDSFDFSADGAFVAVAVGDTIAFEALDKRQSDPLNVFQIPFVAASIRLDHDATMIAASPPNDAGTDAIVVKVESGDQFAFEGPRVCDLQWNPRGRWLALGLADGSVTVWDTEAQDESRFRDLPPSKVGQSAIEHLAWHPRGVLIAGTSSAGKRVHLWHVSKGKLEVTWSGSGSLEQPQFYQDATGGSRLGPVIDGSDVFLLEVAEGRIVSHARGHPGKIFGAWWRDSRVFATAGLDGVRIWNRRGFELAFIAEPEARAAIFTDHGLVITGSNGVSIRPVKGNARSSEISIGSPQRFDAGLSCLDAAYDAVNKRLAVAAATGVRIYDFSAGAASASMPPMELKDSPDMAAFVDFSKDGEWLAAGSNGDGGVKVWGTGGEWQAVDKNFPAAGSANVTFYDDPTPPKDLAKLEEAVALGRLSKEDGRPWHCLVTSGVTEYTFYDIGTWQSRKSIATGLGEIGSITFSPRTPVFGVSEGEWIRIYGLHPFERLISPEFDSQQPVSFSPGGDIIITVDRTAQNTHLHMWDVPLLREELVKLNLDLYLKSFKPELGPASVPIESVTVAD